MEKNSFLVDLDHVLAKATFKDFKAWERLLDETASIDRLGDKNVWASLRSKPPFYLRIITYLAARGSGKYTVKQISQDVELFDEKRKERAYGSWFVSEVLTWLRDRQVMEVRFGTPSSYSEKDDTPIEIDVTPLFWKWGFSKEEEVPR